MPIPIHCPSCKTPLNVPDNLAGSQIRCPRCNTTFMAAGQPPSPTAIQQPPLEQFQTSPAPASAPLPYTPAPAEHFAGGMVAELPGRSLAIVAMVFLGGHMVLDLITILMAGIVYANVPAAGSRQIDAGLRPRTVADEDFVSIMVDCPIILKLGWLIATAVPVCMWFYRAHKNLQLLSVAGMTYSPGGAAGYFFAPVLNIIRPYQVATEIYQASDPQQPLDQPTHWRSASGSVLIGLWWTCWIVSGLVGYIAGKMLEVSPGGTRSIHPALVVNMAADVITMLAAVFLILIIKQIMARQAQKFERVMFAAQSGPL